MSEEAAEARDAGGHRIAVRWDENALHYVATSEACDWTTTAHTYEPLKVQGERHAADAGDRPDPGA